MKMIVFDKTIIKQAVQEAATICPHPCKLTFDFLTLKVVSDRPFRFQGKNSIQFTLTNLFFDSIRQFDKTDACTLIVDYF